MNRLTLRSWTLALALIIGLAGAASASGKDLNTTPGAEAAVAPAVTLSHSSIGLLSAAINSNGTVASCLGCTGAVHLSTGSYEINFPFNVQATNGWSRFVQVDTLSTGSIVNIVCTTADRAGNADAIFVLCVNSAGTDTDTSFFLITAH
jgi:hypothetical protein